jgi:3'(2'), 5'-bisphosphate nucleotidase
MSNVNLDVTQSLINCIQDISVKAANQIIEIYQDYKMGRKDVILENKKDDSALTKADLISHETIYKALKKLTPNIPIISEEVIGSHSLINQKLFWLIDPLDGTKEFILGTDEFTINIALIKNGIVHFGLVMAPALNEMYWGSKLFGSYSSSGGNIKKISISNPLPHESIKLAVSRSHLDKETINFMSTFPNKTSVGIGSSLKFCLIAKGDAHIYPRFGRTCLWDTAAGQSVLENAGGYVSTLSGKAIIYNELSIYNPSFIASAMSFPLISKYKMSAN